MEQHCLGVEVRELRPPVDAGYIWMGDPRLLERVAYLGERPLFWSKDAIYPLFPLSLLLGTTPGTPRHKRTTSSCASTHFCYSCLWITWFSPSFFPVFSVSTAFWFTPTNSSIYPSSADLYLVFHPINLPNRWSQYLFATFVKFAISSSQQDTSLSLVWLNHGVSLSTILTPWSVWTCSQFWC